METIDSNDAGTIVDSSSQELIAEINGKRSLTRVAPLVGVAGAVISLFAFSTERTAWLFFVGLALTIAAFLLLSAYDRNRKTTVLFYDLDSSAEARFKNLYDAFERLSRVGRIWHIPSKGAVHDRKYHAGANELVKRSTIHVSFANPPGLKTNIPTPNLKVGEQTIFFFPERALIFDRKSVGGLLYRNLQFDTATVRFIETEGVPRDSRVVDHTWRYVNKKGGPDKRFKDNRQIPIAEYESVHIRSSAGVNELLHVSQVGAFRGVAGAINDAPS